jgi:dihydrolipoyl dehydrogenase
LSSGDELDVVVIGGGPGGYTAAERVAQLDGKVTLVEKDLLGGNCLNRGCIPAVALLRGAQVFMLAKAASQFGVTTGEVSLDYDELIRRKNDMVSSLVAGTERRVTSAGVNVIKGRASLCGPKAVEVVGRDGGLQTVRANSIIVASGSKPLEPDVKVSGEKGFLMAEEALSLNRLPESMAIVGCDYVGVQLACVFSLLGATVKILESDQRLLLEEDEEIATLLQELLLAYGAETFTGATLKTITELGKEKTLTYLQGGEIRELQVEEVVVSIGRRPNTEGIGLEKAGIVVNGSGGIVVDEHMRTNIPSVYGIGDAVGKFMLAHVAMAEGVVAAENAMGKDQEMEYRAVPRCIFTLPEAASAGLTEAEAREQGRKVRVARVPLTLNGYAHLMGQTEGLVKIVSDAQYGEVLGVQILGPHAGDLIHEAVLGMRLEATAEDVAKAIHVHPSFGEAIKDAAWRLYSPLF